MMIKSQDLTNQNLKEQKSKNFWELNDSKAFIAIALYCVFYFCLRFFQNGSLEGDEIMQLLNGREFVLGDELQPPLYLWAMFLFNKTLGLKFYSILVFRYLLLFAFYAIFYKLARKILKSTIALLATASLVYFPVYSYQMSIHFTHTLLATVIAVFALVIYLKLYEDPSWLNYLGLGLSFGLGLLSKYNFILFIAVLILTSLSFKEGRKVLINLKTVFAIALCFIVFSPHLYFLISGEAGSVDHAMTRGELGSLELTNIFNLGYIVIESQMQPILFAAVFLIVFGRNLNGVRSLFTSANDNCLTRRVFVFSGFYSLIVPVCLIVFARINNFTVAWLAPLFFLVPLAFFALLKHENNLKRNLVLYASATSILILVFAVIKTLIYFYPDLIHKHHQVQYPAKAVSERISELAVREKIKLSDYTLVYHKDRLNRNILLFNNQIAKVIPVFDLKKLKPQKVIYIWEQTAENEKPLQKLIDQNCTVDISEVFATNYTHSSEKVNLGIAFANCIN